MTLPVDYLNETVSLDNHPAAHNDTNTAVNALDGRVTTLEATPSGGGASGHASFTFNSATTAPPIGAQIRINNASQTAATTLWVSQTSVDGLDVSVGLSRVVGGTQIYIQDFDDASKWVKYNVTADAVDSGAYFTFTVTYNSGPANVPFQKIELQPLAPGASAVPPGGLDGQVLTKTSSTNYETAWETPVAAGSVILNGAGAPAVGLGALGDYYLDTTNHILYGPKIAVTAALFESYPDSNRTSFFWMNSGGTTAAGQTFNGAGHSLTSVKFNVKKIGSPTGTAVAKLYAHTGTFGTTGLPTGAALATSNTFDVSTLTTSYTLPEFTFASPYTLVAGTKYCVVLEYTGGNSSNKLEIGIDDSPTHAGNGVTFASSVWSDGGYANDVIFYLYGAGSPWPVAVYGIPTGGTTGQFLKKTSGADYAVAWVT